MAFPFGGKGGLDGISPTGSRGSQFLPGNLVLLDNETGVSLGEVLDFDDHPNLTATADAGIGPPSSSNGANSNLPGIDGLDVVWDHAGSFLNPFNDVIDFNSGHENRTVGTLDFTPTANSGARFSPTPTPAPQTSAGMGFPNGEIGTFDVSAVTYGGSAERASGPELKASGRGADPTQFQTAAFAEGFGGFDIPPPATPALNMSFDAITLAQSGFIPPDPHGAAGFNHLVNVVNVNLEWYTKAGVQQNSQTLQSFFGSPTATFDPKVIYDHTHNRFVMVTLERQNIGSGSQADDVSRIYVAVSDDADPNGTWHRFTINALTNISGTNYWADYPGIAVDDEAIYITNNLFQTEGGGGFFDTGLWIIPKGLGTGGLYDGGGSSFTFHRPYSESAHGGPDFTLQPANVLAGAMPGNSGVYLVGFDAFVGNDNLDIIRVVNPLAGPTFVYQSLGVGNITDAVVPDADQPGAFQDIDAGDFRTYEAVWRNGRLLVTNTINPVSGPDAGQATAHWYDIDTTAITSVSLTQQGNIGGEDIGTGVHTYYPAIAANNAGTIAIGFAASGPTVNAGSYYTIQQVGDGAGSVQNSQVLRAGQSSYVLTDSIGRNRWGDYTAIVTDPANDSDFWVFNEHVRAQNQWGTAWGKFTTSDVRVIPLPNTLGWTNVSVADFNADGALDLLWKADGSGATSLWILSPTGGFGTNPFTPGAAGWTAVARGDFNGDGTGDVMWKADGSGATSLWLLSGSGIAGNPFTPGAGGWTVVATGDFNADGTTDMMWKADGSGATSLWLMSGGGLTSNPFTPGAGGWSVVATGDFDGSGTTDIMWKNDASGATSLWLMSGGGLASNPFTPGAGGWSVVATGDFDGSGTTDIMWKADGSGATSLWLMSGGGLAGNPGTPGAGGWTVAGVGDMNNDGTSDIIWTADGSGATSRWLMSGGGLAGNPSSPDSDNWNPVGVGPFNLDGTTDIVWRDPDDGAVTEWLI